MNAPVDVLAVMDRMIESNRRAGIAEVGDFAELIEARAAVAELIEADKEMQFIRNNGCSAEAYEAAVIRHNDAIARVSGGAA